MVEITLSSNEFKALSSDTRVHIIKLLKQRNHTLTEISSKLNLASPTIKQHLDILVQSNLVQLNDEGRKWKYYALTRKGKNILEPSMQTNVLILVGISFIALMFVTYLFSFTLQQGSLGAGMRAQSKDYSAKITAPQTAAPSAGETAGTADSETSELGRPIAGTYGITIIQLIAFLALIIALSMALGFFAGKIKKRNSKP
ncbi:MAG: winged helix-turn-helix domain-containing protein [Candidatus Diapherotrites archaeon]